MLSRFLSRLVVCIAAIFALGAPAYAAPTSYFASFGGNENSIGKYPTTVDAWGIEFASASGAHGLTIAGEDLYWVEGNDIYRQNVHSGPKTLFQSFGISPLDLAVDALNGSYYASFGGGTDSIGKYPLTPNSWGIEFATGNDAHGLSLSGNTMYWLEGNDIWMQAIDSMSKTLLQSFGIAPLDLAVDSLSGFYYASFGGSTDSLGKYPLTPMSWGTEFATGNDTHGLNIVDGKLYWLEGPNIWMADLDGSNKQRLQTFGVSPLDLALYSPPIVVDPDPPVIPEPASLSLLGLGFAALGWMRRKTR